MKLRQGNVFTPVCHSVHMGGSAIPPGQTAPLCSACWDTVNKRAVRILLECILVMDSDSGLDSNPIPVRGSLGSGNVLLECFLVMLMYLQWMDPVPILCQHWHEVKLAFTLTLAFSVNKALNSSIYCLLVTRIQRRWRKAVNSTSSGTFIVVQEFN